MSYITHLQKRWDDANRPVNPKDFATPALAKYAIAAIRAGNAYDNTDPVIINARKRYDTGMATMVTGRNGDVIVLYCIPHRWKVTRRRPWFSARRFPL